MASKAATVTHTLKRRQNHAGEGSNWRIDNGKFTMKAQIQ